MKHTFTGDVTTTYAEYIDAAEGRTLVAAPGGTYEIRAAAGVTRPGMDGVHAPADLPVPPDDRWKRAAAKKDEKGDG